MTDLVVNKKIILKWILKEIRDVSSEWLGISCGDLLFLIM